MGEGFELAMDFIKHRLRPQQHIVIPESQDTISIDSQLPGSLLIVVMMIEMLATIQLDHYRRFDASEVGDVPGDRQLPPELEAAQLTATQELPQFALCVGPTRP